MLRRATLSLLCSLAAGCTVDTLTVATPSLVAASFEGEPDRVPPTATLSLTFSAPVDADSVDEESIVVVRGAADDKLVAELRRPPLPDQQRSRLAPMRFTVEGAVVQLRPARPLEPETLHTMIVTTRLRAGGVALARPALRPFTTGPASSGPPSWTLVRPASGAVDVVRNLRAVEVAFSRPVEGVDALSLVLVDEGGTPVEAAVAPSGRDNGFLISPALLGSRRRYQVVAGDGIRDDDGEPPFALDAPPGFTTGAMVRSSPPSIAGAALLASSGCLVARWSTDVAASTRLCVDGDCREEESLALQHEVTHPLAAGSGAAIVLSSRDASTAPPATLGPVAAPASSPRELTITEVLAHPRGPRLAQQFVEVHNRGAVAVALDGLELHNDTGFNVVPDGTLAPGGYALIVPADFAADDGADVPPAAGALILPVAERHLGGHGLRQSGDTVTLVEPDGRPVSRLSTVGLRLAKGQSARRVDRCDLAASWQPSPDTGATPGWE